MPELPEVETVRLYLDQHLPNLAITSLDILNDKSFDGDAKGVVGQKFIQFRRQGKQLSAHLSNGLVLLFHLKMTGQLIHLSSSRKVFGHPTADMNTSPLPNKSTRVVFYLSDHSTLYFNDQRKFGWIKVFTPDTLAKFQSGLGIDILDDQFTLEYFSRALSTTSRSIKLVLLDQSHFAGIGNIYANDALFEARVHPLTPASSLSSPPNGKTLFISNHYYQRIDCSRWFHCQRQEISSSRRYPWLSSISFSGLSTGRGTLFGLLHSHRQY